MKNTINFKASPTGSTENMLFHFVFSSYSGFSGYSLNLGSDNRFSKELIAHQWYKVHF